MKTKKKSMRKWTWERVLEAVETNLKGWEVVQEEPENVNAHLRVKLLCDRGHRNDTKTVNNIERGIGLGCKDCKREYDLKDCYENFVEALEAEGWTMVSTLSEMLESEKSPAHTPLKVKCPNGKPQPKTFDKFTSAGSRCTCSKCVSKGTRKFKRRTLEDVKKEYLGKGFEFLEDEWRGIGKRVDGKVVNQKYRTKCLECGHEWTPFATHILNHNSGCPVCSNRYEDLGTLTKWTKANRPKFEIVQEQEYMNNKTEIKIRCLEHDEVFSVRPHTFKIGGRNGCQKCQFERQSKVSIEMNKHFDKTGKNSPNWNGFRPLRDYLRTQLSEWKKHSMRAHGYKCFVTGGAFDVVHHLNGFNVIVEETLIKTGLPLKEKIDDYSQEELNQLTKMCLMLHVIDGLGIPLSEEVHNDFHSIYDKGDNTIDQFVEYLQSIGQKEKAKKLIRTEIKRQKLLKINYPQYKDLAS